MRRKLNLKELLEEIRVVFGKNSKLVDIDERNLGKKEYFIVWIIGNNKKVLSYDENGNKHWQPVSWGAYRRYDKENFIVVNFSPHIVSHYLAKYFLIHELSLTFLHELLHLILEEEGYKTTSHHKYISYIEDMLRKEFDEKAILAESKKNGYQQFIFLTQFS